MKYACFAFLQRWPTSRTQKDSFNTEGLTCDKYYSTTFIPRSHSVPHTHLLGSVLMQSRAEDSFACLLSDWFYHGSSPPNRWSKFQSDSDMDTAIMKKKINIIPTGICRYFSPFQKLITHLQGQKCSQFSRHKPIKSISRTSELGSTIILFTSVDSQNKTLEKDTRYCKQHEI